MVRALLVGLPVVAAVLNTALGLYAMRFRTVPAARTFALVLFLVALWGVCYGCEVAAPDLASKILWLKLRSPLFFITPLWLVMCLQLTGRDKKLRPWHVAALCALPLVTLLLQLTTERTGLVRHDLHLITTGPVPLLAWTASPLYLVYIAYVRLLTICSLFIVAWSYRGAHDMARNQVVLVLGGSLLVLFSDGVAAHGLKLIPGYNITPVMFILTGAMVALALFRYGMFSIVPIARSLIDDHMRAAVLVLDTEHRIVRVNKAAERLLAKGSAELIGSSTAQAAPRWSELVTKYWEIEETNDVVALPHGGEESIFDLSITPLRDSRGLLLGRLVTLYDITELKLAQHAAEEALANVRTLTGLLPICASCKMIRDDQGYWQAVEHYVSEHTDAEFTHGLCPECSGKYFDRAMKQPGKRERDGRGETQSQAGT